uniref:Uncharacterized protein n=1 Tax=Meloidogyne javanica TaxID=6303 RepID=A0A915LJX4_MELJA
MDNDGFQEFVSKRKLKNEKKAKEIVVKKKPSTSMFNVRQSNRGGFQGPFVSKGNSKKIENTIADKNKPPKPSTLKSNGIETKSKVVQSQVKKSANGSSFVVGCSYSSVVESSNISQKPVKSTSVGLEQLSISKSNGNDLEENKYSSSGLGDDRINQSDGTLDNLQAEAAEGIDNVVEDHRPPSGDSGVSCTSPSSLHLPIKQFSRFGFKYPSQCTDYVYQCLCRDDMFESGQKVYEYPDEFIRDAKEALMVENWILTDKFIKFSAHNVCFALALLGAKCSSEGAFLGSVICLMNFTHCNHYFDESTRDDVINFIAKIEKFARHFGQIKADDVGNLLKDRLPKQSGASSVYEGITFKKLEPFTAGFFGRNVEFEYVAYIPKIY